MVLKNEIEFDEEDAEAGSPGLKYNSRSPLSKKKKSNSITDLELNDYELDMNVL